MNTLDELEARYGPNAPPPASPPRTITATEFLSILLDDLDRASSTWAHGSRARLDALYALNFVGTVAWQCGLLPEPPS